ncbi:MAG: hypothetical protein IPJ74_16590 [Saprospiraceae bacterium]|nr:hypothetical protein [Saprospiraceae bacterium]
MDKPIPNVTVQIKGREPVKADENGRFFLCIPAFEILNMSVEKEMYNPYENEFIIPFWDNKQFYTIEILMDPIRRPEPTLVAKSPYADTAYMELKRRRRNGTTCIPFSLNLTNTA